MNLMKNALGSRVTGSLSTLPAMARLLRELGRKKSNSCVELAAVARPQAAWKILVAKKIHSVDQMKEVVRNTSHVE